MNILIESGNIFFNLLLRKEFVRLAMHCIDSVHVTHNYPLIKDNDCCSLYFPSIVRLVFYASPTSGEAYRDRRLTTNFEFWVEIFCVPTCFHMRIPKPCLSVCPHPEKRYHHSFVNISPTLVIDTSMERSSRVLQHGNPKIWFFFSKKFEIRILTKSWNHLSFVSISPTLVIDTSMERSSRVLQHGNPKIWFFFSKKFEIQILTFDEELKSP